ncbi:hypothetical protein Fcan01_08642 [Folsomia candida]|uniref:Uncharacterized protein n=1 Tax=Folsomia candida TaxID=158441 RepID=A0A226EFT0_FOLCA|nr:hypothetical protein Fcan01_08642 [Folsomia candida]
MNGLFYMCILSPDVSPVRHATCIFFANGAALLNLFNVYNFTKRVEILDMLQLFIDYGEDEGSSICAKDTLADLVMKLGCYSSIILPLCLTILGATMSCEAPFVGAVLIDCSVQDGTHLLSKSILTLFDLWMNMFELTNAFWSVFIVLFPGIRFILDSLGYLVRSTQKQELIRYQRLQILTTSNIVGCLRLCNYLGGWKIVYLGEE